MRKYLVFLVIGAVAILSGCTPQQEIDHWVACHPNGALSAPIC